MVPPSKQVDEKEHKPFDLKVAELSVHVGLLNNKAIGIAKNICEMFQQNKRLPDLNASNCPACNKKFIVFYRKRHPCSICGIPYCIR